MEKSDLEPNLLIADMKGKEGGFVKEGIWRVQKSEK